jgi:hypothetical protein
MISRAIRLTVLCAMLLALVMATTASAQSTPAQDVYNPNGDVLNVVSGGGGSPSSGAGAPAQTEAGTAASSGSLPFTGFEAGLVAVAGVALLGTGFAMRRIARHDS